MGLSKRLFLAPSRSWLSRFTESAFQSGPDLEKTSGKAFIHHEENMDERGLNNKRVPGDPLYWDAADPRPWVTYLEEGERHLNACLAAGGTPSHLLNTDPTGQQVIGRTGE